MRRHAGVASFGVGCATKTDIEDLLRQVEARAKDATPAESKNSLMTFKADPRYMSASAEANVKAKAEALENARPGMDQIKKASDLWDAIVKAEEKKIQPSPREPKK